jgi:hypothetical protein
MKLLVFGAGEFGDVIGSRGLHHRLSVADLEGAPELVEALVQAVYRLYRLVPSHQSIENVCMNLDQTHESVIPYGLTARK